MPREPGYCHHKAKNLAYVRLNGQQIYLGEYGTEESKEAYNRIKAEWLTNRHSPKFNPKASTGPTMAEVCLAFLEHAEKSYPTSDEAYQYGHSLKPISEMYATLPAAEFGPSQFKSARDWWNKRKGSQNGADGKPVKISRQYVNKMAQRIQYVVKWAVGEGMMPPSSYHALQCVGSLKRGRSGGLREAEPIEPVDSATIEATKKHLPQVVRDMIDIQLMLGCRPGEVCKLTPAMIDRSDDIWKIRLRQHKTAWRGKQRTLYAGPKSQAILKRYLLRGADDPLFSPSEAMRQRREAKSDARITPITCGNRPGTKQTKNPKRRAGTAYDSRSYFNAIRYACAVAGIKAWGPNRLRHKAASDIRQQFGLDSAQAILGHAEISTTQIYAVADAQRAIAVAKAIG